MGWCFDIRKCRGKKEKLRQLLLNSWGLAGLEFKEINKENILKEKTGIKVIERKQRGKQLQSNSLSAVLKMMS